MTFAGYQRALLAISALCAATFLAITAAKASTWTELGPNFAGRVSGIVATDGSHVWVTTPGGGVWKSSDGGATFTWAGNYALGDFTVDNIALDRNDPTRMYLRTFSGVLVSTDGAAHWTRTLYALRGDVPFPYPAGTCSSWPTCAGSEPSVNPEDPGPWAQTTFSSAQSVIVTSLPCQGLQYSTDNGNHFTQLWPFGNTNPQNPDNCINGIAIDDITRSVWFTTMNDLPPHIYRSHVPWTAAGPPAGLTWDLVTNGIAFTDHEAAGITWGGNTADRMMALVYNGSVNQPYLFDGTTWTAKPAACAQWGARPLVAGGNGNDFFLGGRRFAYTLDAGTNWICPAIPAQYDDTRAIFASASSHRLWIGADQNALGLASLMTRFTWSPGVAPSLPVALTPNGIRSWQAYTVAKSPLSNRLFLGAQDVALVCSDDGGVHWVMNNVNETLSVAWAKTAGGNTAYSFGTQSNAQVSTNALSATTCSGVSWPGIGTGAAVPFADVHDMAIDPVHETHVFLLRGSHVSYSLNSGGNWGTSSPGLTTPTGHPVGLTAVFVDENGVLYVGTNDRGVYTCSDVIHYCDGSGGAGSWAPFALNASGPWFVTAIAESNAPPGPRNFWIATSSGVYRQLAGSPAWTPSDAIYVYPYSEVVVDPNCRTRIYTGVGYLDKFLRTRGGVHFSSDNGAHWTSLTAGYDLHNVPITQILIDPADSHHVYATTYGRGLWRYDWTALPPCVP